MEMLLVFLILPIVAGLFAKYYLKDTYTWPEFFLSVAITGVVMSVVYAGGLYTSMSDTEIINGEITGKERVHDSYIRSYSCNPRQVCSGSGSSRSCTTVYQTCYENRYTVTWQAASTVGNIQFDHKDSTSRSVYNSDDPQAYVDCYVGEPASAPNTFTNYVKAVPTSLFNSQDYVSLYQEQIPEYPRVHSFYKVNRVINVSSQVSQNLLLELDRLLDQELKRLGPTKQSNIIVIVTDILDPNYRHAVEDAWIGGKKNDVILFFGTRGNEIVWADAMTWALNSGNEFFVADLKSKLQDLKQFGPLEITQLTASAVMENYTRPNMEDYEYLKSDIRPSTTLLVVSWILNFVLVIGLTWWFHAKVQITSNQPSPRNYRSRY
jgi:hypothetical protein